MIAQICGAMQGALEYFANPGDLKNFVMWSMGSLSNTGLKDALLFSILGIVFIVITLFYIKPLQAFILGQNYTTTLGINYQKKRFALIFISSTLTGIATAFCGPIAFVGISVPLLSRLVFKTANQGIQIFACILIGAIILLFSDVICHSFAFTLPINMITTLIGAPCVIYMLFKNKKL
jgi:iron complex transport system permease protein